MKARFALALGLIALAAFTWRVGYILTVTQHQQLGIFSTTEHAQPDVVRSVDEYYYAGGATNIVHGKAFTERLVGYPPGTPVALHPPLTEVVLAPTAWIFDGSQLAMRITVAAAGALVVVVIGLIGRDLRNERAGLIAAGLAAVHPSLWVHDALIMSETFAALTTALIIWCTYRLVRRPGPWPAIATGVVCGLAALARSELIVLAPLVVAPAIWFGAATAGRRRRLTAVAVLGVATLLTILPWTIYNLGRFEKTVLLSYGDGSTIQGANCDRTYHGPAIGSWDGVCARIGPSGEPSVVAAEQRREGFAYLSDHAGRLPVVIAARLGRVAGVYRPMAMLDDYQREGKPFWASFSGWLLSLVLLPFAAYGLRILGRRTTLIPLVGVVVVVLVTAAMFYGNFRIRVPIDVVLVITAAVGLDAAYRPRPRAA